MVNPSSLKIAGSSLGQQQQQQPAAAAARGLLKEEAAGSTVKLNVDICLYYCTHPFK